MACTWFIVFIFHIWKSSSSTSRALGADGLCVLETSDASVFHNVGFIFKSRLHPVRGCHPHPFPLRVSVRDFHGIIGYEYRLGSPLTNYSTCGLLQKVLVNSRLKCLIRILLSLTFRTENRIAPKTRLATKSEVNLLSICTYKREQNNFCDSWCKVGQEKRDEVTKVT